MVFIVSMSAIDQFIIQYRQNILFCVYLDHIKKHLSYALDQSAFEHTQLISENREWCEVPIYMGFD